MYDYEEDGIYKYSPNELVYLEKENPEKYQRVIERNTGKSVEQFHRDNLEYMREYLKHLNK